MGRIFYDPKLSFENKKTSLAGIACVCGAYRQNRKKNPDSPRPSRSYRDIEKLVGLSATSYGLLIEKSLSPLHSHIKNTENSFTPCYLNTCYSLNDFKQFLNLTSSEERDWNLICSQRFSGQRSRAIFLPNINGSPSTLLNSEISLESERYFSFLNYVHVLNPSNQLERLKWD